MSDLDESSDRTRKERSPSFPFISLPKAVERARAFSDVHRRSPARVATVADTWGYAPSSSGLQQTVAALKAYGLMEDVGRGQDRKIQLSDLANRILHDSRPGAKESSTKEAALRPRLFAEYAEKWLPDRPGDNHRLSELHLDRGFTTVAAQMFLRSFDETVTFASLNQSDDLSSNLSDDVNEPTGTTVHVPAATLHMRTSPPEVPRPTRFYGGGGEAVGPPRATLPLPEGLAALEIPSGLSRKSWEAMKAWAELLVTLAQPMPDHLVSKIGANLTERAGSGFEDADHEE